MGESHDYANHLSSLNGRQIEADEEGKVRYVVTDVDPGVPNWVDTTGIAEGYMAMRWTYPQAPGQLPTVSVTKIRAADVRSHFPEGTRFVSPEERREQIGIRQAHVQRRYRQY